MYLGYILEGYAAKVTLLISKGNLKLGHQRKSHLTRFQIELILRNYPSTDHTPHLVQLYLRHQSQWPPFGSISQVACRTSEKHRRQAPLRPIEQTLMRGPLEWTVWHGVTIARFSSFPLFSSLHFHFLPFLSLCTTLLNNLPTHCKKYNQYQKYRFLKKQNMIELKLNKILSSGEFLSSYLYFKNPLCNLIIFSSFLDNKSTQDFLYLLFKLLKILICLL